MPVIYAMVGTIGSGKTFYARKLAAEKKAMLFCIDETIKKLGQPIKSKEDYDKYYFGIREIISDHALEALKLGISVVFDFGGNIGHWEWLRSLANQANANVEITHLLAPIDIRRTRVRKRNLEPHVVFKFSDEEFDSMPTESAAPTPQKGLKIVVIDTAQ